MRTHSNTETTGLPKYEAVPLSEVRMLSQYLRSHGYYTTNNAKRDYQFKAPASAWHDSGPLAHWRNRPQGMPFFSVVNFNTTHESGLFEPYGFRHGEDRHYFSTDEERKKTFNRGKKTEAETAVNVAKDIEFIIPPYLPDTPLVRRDMWKMYNNIAEMDKHVGAIMAQLKSDGLLENTVVFFYADHGGPLPRQKRMIYDSGLRVPFIARFPQKWGAGTTDDQLISFIDLPATTMALAGMELPQHLHGQNFLDDDEREYVHAAADRFDGYTDTIRAVRNKRFKYIRHYRPEQPYYLPVKYREQIPTMQELLRLHKANALTPEQAQWFRPSKPPEELFDLSRDPYELNNIVDDPTHASVLSSLRAEMNAWLSEIGDDPYQSESELIRELWSQAKTQPVTAAPVLSIENHQVSATSDTPGAIIEYAVADDSPKKWLPFDTPLVGKKDQTIHFRAHRIGYKPSQVVRYLP